MKIYHKTIDYLAVRDVTQFLYFPKTIGNVTRWLEVASWREKVNYQRATPVEEGYNYWEAIEWTDLNEKK